MPLRADEFSTSDLDIASYLLGNQICNLRGIEEKKHKRYFILSPRPEPSVIADYVNNCVSIQPAAYADARRKLVTAMQVCLG